MISLKQKLYSRYRGYREEHNPDGSLRERVLCEIDQPIRGIINRLNLLPFVYATISSCSGHIELDRPAQTGYVYLRGMPGKKFSEEIEEFTRRLNCLRIFFEEMKPFYPRWRDVMKDPLHKHNGRNPAIAECKCFVYSPESLEVRLNIYESDFSFFTLSCLDSSGKQNERNERKKRRFYLTKMWDKISKVIGEFENPSRHQELSVMFP